MICQAIKRFRERWAPRSPVQPEPSSDTAADIRSRRHLAAAAAGGLGALLAERAAAAADISTTTAPLQMDMATSRAVGDGVTDDQPAIQAWLNELSKKYDGGEIVIPPGKYYRIHSATLTVPHRFTIRGAFSALDNMNTGGSLHTGAGGFIIDANLPVGISLLGQTALKNLKVLREGLLNRPTEAQANAAVMQWASEAFNRRCSGNAAGGQATIPFNDTSGITEGMPVTGPQTLIAGYVVRSVIRNTSISLNKALDAGAGSISAGMSFRFGGSLAIQITQGSGVVLEDIVIIGFHTGIQAFPGQFYVNRVRSDCITNFEAIRGGDTAWVSNCEFLELYGGATVTRPGASVFCHDGGTTVFFDNVFAAWGWRVGFHFYNSGGVSCVNCGNEAGQDANLVNFWLEKTSQVALYNCRAESGGIGYHIQDSSAFYLCGCTSASGQANTAHNTAHFLIESTTTSINTTGAIIAPQTLSYYPSKVPIKFDGPQIANVALVAPNILDLGSTPTTQFIAGRMPRSQVPEILQGVMYSGVGSGGMSSGSVAIGASYNGLIHSSNESIATFTITLPPHPCDGQICKIWHDVEIGKLTMKTLDGSAVGNHPNPAAGSLHEWVYSLAQHKWFCGA